MGFEDVVSPADTAAELEIRERHVDLARRKPAGLDQAIGVHRPLRHRLQQAQSRSRPTRRARVRACHPARAQRASSRPATPVRRRAQPSSSSSSGCAHSTTHVGSRPTPSPTISSPDSPSPLWVAPHPRSSHDQGRTSLRCPPGCTRGRAHGRARRLAHPCSRPARFWRRRLRARRLPCLEPRGPLAATTSRASPSLQSSPLARRALSRARSSQTPTPLPRAQR